MYTVKEAAKLTGLSEHTIRYYTNKDLVPMVQRNDNNNRSFDDVSIRWLQGVKCFRELGIPIETIKYFCSLTDAQDPTLEIRLGVMTKQREIAEKHLKEVKNRVKFIKKMEKELIEKASLLNFL